MKNNDYRFLVIIMTAQFGEEEPFSLNGLSTDTRRKAACGRTEYHSKLSSSKHPPGFCLLGYSGLCIIGSLHLGV